MATLNKDKFLEIAINTQSDWKMGGLAEGLYFDFYVEVVQTYLSTIEPDYNNLMKRLMVYIPKYEISFQFWGKDYNQVFIMRHDVEIYSTGGHETPADAIKDALKWLDRVNTKPKKS